MTTTNTITTSNPTTGEPLEIYDLHTPNGVTNIVRDVHKAFDNWRGVSLPTRSDLLRALAKALRSDQDQLATLMAQEMGKPIVQGKAEIEKCAWACDHYADLGPAYLQDEHVDTGLGKTFVTYRPLGVVLAVMPWNFPFWQVLRFAVPTLMAGNVVLLKHAPNVTGCALAIERLFRTAGFPEDIFRTVLLDEAGTQRLIRHRLVRGITLTGSVRAGKAVAKQAASRVKKTVLELGGSDPYVVLDDADLDLAVETCVKARLHNAGQTCIAATRWIVTPKVRDDFRHRVLERLRRVRVGDPMDTHTEVGPMARRDLRDSLHALVEASVGGGAKCLLGGVIESRPGFFYPPTLLDDVAKGIPAYGEELFGPVAAILNARSERHAIKLANDTDYGLGAVVFTQDTERGEWIASKELVAGTCCVNMPVKSDPRLPFGGVGHSGYGRELGREGIREFVNIKSVWVA